MTTLVERIEIVQKTLSTTSDEVDCPLPSFIRLYPSPFGRWTITTIATIATTTTVCLFRTSWMRTAREPAHVPVSVQMSKRRGWKEEKKERGMVKL